MALSNLFDMINANPMWQQGLHGLATSGETAEDKKVRVLEESNMMDMALQQAKLEEHQTRLSRQNAFRERAGTVDWANMNPQELRGILELADEQQIPKILELYQNAQATKGRNEMLSGIFGQGGEGGGGDAMGGAATTGSGIDPSRLANGALALGAAGDSQTGNLLMSGANFYQNQANRETDKASDADNRNYSRLGELQKTYTANAGEYLAKIEDYQTARKLYTLAEEEPEQAGPADVGLIKIGVQMYDKRPSVVRDEEAAQIAQSGGLKERFGALFDNYRYGEKLTTQQRQALLAATRVGAETYQSSLDRFNKGFKTTVEKAGQSWDDVYDPYKLPTLDDIDKEFAPKANIPEGISPELWDAMPEEDRKLWQQ